MSNLTTGTTKIKCEKALGQACEELGLKLETDAQARTYYGTKQFPLVAKLKGPYDVGFTRNSDGVLDATTDWHGGHVAREVGEKFKKLEDVYFAHRLTNKFKAKGLFVNRTVNKKGGIRLTVTGVAL